MKILEKTSIFRLFPAFSSKNAGKDSGPRLGARRRRQRHALAESRPGRQLSVFLKP
jgi:hypothetical protein